METMDKKVIRKSPEEEAAEIEQLMGNLPTIDDRLVFKMAFDGLTSEQSKILLSNHLYDLADSTKALMADLQGQLDNYRLGLEVGRDPDPHWLKKVSAMHSRLTVLHIRLTSRVRAQNRQNTSKSNQRVAELVNAIQTHRAATLLDDLEPTDADMALWGILDV